MKYQYIVLKADEDGNPVRFVTEEELRDDYLSEARSYHFLGEADLDQDKCGTNPQYWPLGWDGDEKTGVMIVEIKAIRVPRPVTTEYEL
jgi:hypothetical protein